MSCLLVTSHGSARLEFAESWLQQRRGAVLVAAPSQGAADDLARAAASAGGGLALVYRTSFRRLATTLATPWLAERGLAPLSRLGTEALAARTIDLSLRTSGVGFFHAVADMPGFPRALSKTLSSLIENGVGPARLASGPYGCPELAAALETIGKLEQEQRLATGARVLASAVELLESGLVRLPADTVLLLDPAPESLLEELFLVALVARSRDALVTALAADRPSLRRLSARLNLVPQPLDQAAQDPRRLCRVQRELFEAQPAGEALAIDGSFEFFSAPSEGRECVELARRVRRLARAGMPFDRMAVWLRDPDLYLPHLQDALERADIPAYFTVGTTRPSPAGRAFLALLDCAADRLSAARFAEYLSLAQVPRPSAEPEEAVEVPWVPPSGDGQLTFKTPVEPPPEVAATAPGSEASEEAEAAPPAPFRWEELLVEASVVGGAQRWQKRLQGLEAELRLRLASASEDEAAQAGLRQRLEGLERLKNFALPLIRRLADLPSRALWGEWLDALRRLAAEALAHPEPVLRLLAELEPMAQVGPVVLSEVRSVLAEHLLFLRSEPPENRYGRLLVGTLEESPGRRFDAVFIPGLAEGVLPRKVFEDPLLLDEVARELGLPLPNRRDRIARERLLLSRGVATATQLLVVSFPRMDLLQGRARVPSLHALEVLRAAEGRIPDLRELEKRSADEPVLRLGWPAPADPQAAIDDAEYDLACLEPLLHDRTRVVRGQGRFLLELNPWLAQSLRARFKRWEQAWYDDDGLVATKDPAVLRRLSLFRLRERPFSPTSLQHYAACPYRFFLHGIQRLRPREGITTLERMDPLVRGSLVHEVQFGFFRLLEQDGLADPGRTSLEQWLDRVDKVLDQVAGRYAEDLAPALPRVWQGEVEELRVDLRCWVRERYQQGARWLPHRWEFAFGLPHEDGRDPRSRDQEAILRNGYRLRGAIDLIERDAERGLLRITDHKTGKSPEQPVRWVGGGELLQPLLYAMAAERLLGEPVESGRLFYCTQRGGFRVIEIPLEPGTRKMVEWILDTIDEAISTGFLPAAPRKDACTWCDYRPVCGPYEELRVGRKPREQLKNLHEMRELQ
jgi:CRISPR/Cas system-associated exonuclease Cas4 (RecB family)